MTHWASGHPDDGVLLRYLDGELPGREMRWVRAHLEACWQCRCEREALESTVGDCVEYRRKVLAAGLPEPPQPWIDLYTAMDRQDARAEKSGAWFGIGAGWRWAAAAVVAALAVGVLYRQFERPPAVEAAALLNRAVAAEQARPARPQRVRIRAGRQEYVRNGDARAASQAGNVEAMPAAMKALFARAHYDAGDPLSARAYAEWRDGAGEKRDRVTETAGRYEIHTVVFSGELAEASLTLVAADLEPVAGKLQFRDSESLEFSKVSEPPAPADGFAVASHEEVPLRPAVPSRPAAITPGPSASISDELAVLAALHKIGADLGDPVQVTLADGKVAVEGAGVGAERQRQIHAMLDANPNVVVKFSDPASSVAIPVAGAEVAPAAAPPAPRLESRLEALAGGHAQWEEFSSRLLDANEAAMARAYALRRLARQFPAGGSASLSAAEQHTLQTLVAEHVSAMAGQVEAMENRLKSLLAGLGAPIPKPAPAVRFADWQTGSEETFQAARREEMLISVLLGVAPGPEPAALPADLARTLLEVRADLDECRRVLGQ
ncbi:MAG: zf-HC2 domain-containing protein [Bryobacteraceae bacterium]